MISFLKKILYVISTVSAGSVLMRIPRPQSFFLLVNELTFRHYSQLVTRTNSTNLEVDPVGLYAHSDCL